MGEGRGRGGGGGTCPLYLLPESAYASCCVPYPRYVYHNTTYLATQIEETEMITIMLLHEESPKYMAPRKNNTTLLTVRSPTFFVLVEIIFSGG